MQNNKGFTPIVAIIAIVAVLTVGTIVYYIKNSNPFNKETKKESLPEENQNNTTDSKADNAVNNDLIDQSSIKNNRVTILYPNGGERFNRYDKISIKWKINKKAEDKNSRSSINLCKENNEECWELIPTAHDDVDTAVWVIETPPAGRYKIKIINISYDGQVTSEDMSDNAFFILPNVPPSEITVKSPNGGEIIKIGNDFEIKWSSSNVKAGTVSIGLRVTVGHDDLNFTITNEAQNKGSYIWKTDEDNFPITGTDRERWALIPLDKMSDFRIVIATPIDKTIENSFQIGNETFVRASVTADESDGSFIFQ